MSEKMMLDIGDTYVYRDKTYTHAIYVLKVIDIDTCELLVGNLRADENAIFVDFACKARIDVSEKQLNKAKMLGTSAFYINKEKGFKFKCLETRFRTKYSEYRKDYFKEIAKQIGLKRRRNIKEQLMWMHTYWGYHSLYLIDCIHDFDGTEIMDIY